MSGPGIFSTIYSSGSDNEDFPAGFQAFLCTEFGEDGVQKDLEKLRLRECHFETSGANSTAKE